MPNNYVEQIVSSLGMPNLSLVLPEIIILITAFILLVVELFNKNRTLITSITLGGLSLSLISLFTFISKPITGTTFYDLIIIDGFSTVGKIFLIIATMFIILNFPSYYEQKKSFYGEYYYITLFALLGLMIMISSANLVSFYIGLELASISVYILAGMFKKDYLSKEGAFKYLIIGGAGTAIISYAIALIYGATGSFAFDEIATYLNDTGGYIGLGMLGGIVLLIVGLGLKASAVPFHHWTPDAYEGASTPITAFMATVVKIATYLIIAKILVLAFPIVSGLWSIGWAILAAASMIIGNFIALKQDNVKRMLAYSSIAHTGYITAALASGTESGISALIFYSLIYIFMSIGGFIFLAAMEKAKGWSNHINDFKGLAKKNPLMALFMLIIMFSMLGIPPTVGFMGKFGVFIALIDQNIWWLALVLVVMSIVSAGYYLRVVIYMYMYEPENDKNPELALPEIFTVSFMSLFILILGIYPTIFFKIAGDLASLLFKYIQ